MSAIVQSHIEYGTAADEAVQPSNSIITMKLGPGPEVSYRGADLWIWANAKLAHNPPNWSEFASLTRGHDDSTFEDIEHLEDDWDGEGTLAPTPEILDATKRIIATVSQLLPKPDITPNENGTITIEWHTHSDYASLEVGAGNFAFMMHFDRDKTRFLNGALPELTLTMADELEQALFWRRTRALGSGNGWAYTNVDHY